MKPPCLEPECSAPSVARSLCSKHYQKYRYHGQLDDVAPEPTQKACACCGGIFAAQHRRWGAMYCSKQCNDNARHARKRVARGRRRMDCEQCGASLVDRRVNARFCSDKCGQDWRNARTATELLERKARSGRVCRGCEGPISPTVRGNALYCSDECKMRAKRFEAYGLAPAEFRLLMEQHAVCAICQSDEWGIKGPSIDHDHSTGMVRGILCNNCNNGIGRFKDDPVRLRAAAEYLERHQ